MEATRIGDTLALVNACLNGLSALFLLAGYVFVKQKRLHLHRRAMISAVTASALFLVFYLRFVGRHSWLLTSLLAVLTPVVTFFFFEIALTITLPKGKTEPLFYPLYDLFL